MRPSTVEDTLPAYSSGTAVLTSALAPGNRGSGETTDTGRLHTGARRPGDHREDGSLAASVVNGVKDVLFGWWRRRETKRRPARYWPSYLDICTSMERTDEFSYKTDEFDGKSVGDILKGCASVWAGEKGAGYRPVGCGDRDACPLCADYYHMTVARGSIEMLTESIEAVLASGVKLDTWGFHYVFTLPKELSEYLDGLLQTDRRKFRELANKLRQAAARRLVLAVRRACEDVGEPVPGELGMMAALHDRGDSEPWAPHYHWHFVVAPYTADYEGKGGIGRETRALSGWRSVPRWWSQESLDALTDSWKKSAEKILGLKYGGKWNVHRGYIKTRKSLAGTMAYQLRAPMRGLWVGMRGDAAEGFHYVRKARGKAPAIDKAITTAQFEEALERARLMGRKDVVQRVTWYGLLVNNRQCNTLKQLGMSHVDLDDDPDAKGRGPDTRYWKAVAEWQGGVVMKCTQLGSEEVDFVTWSDLRPDPVGFAGAIGVARRRIWLRLRKIRAGPITK